MTIIYFVLILGITVFIHELGHFIFAKRAGIYVYEFALGMGPKLFSFKRKNDETTYSLRLLPIGGFVQLAGEAVEDDKEVPNSKKLPNKKWSERFLTIGAGIFFNFVLAIILFFIIALISGAPQLKPIINDVAVDSPAALAGFQKGDIIVSVDNAKVYSMDDLLLEFTVADKPIIIKVKRGNDYVSAKIDKVDGAYGFYLDKSIEKGLLPSIKYAFLKTGAVLHQMVIVIFYLITTKINLNALAGPVGIYAIVDDAAKVGILNLMYINAVISINVGFVNLLPIPAFDGGRLLFLIIEKIKGKPVDSKYENIIHTIGFALLMLLMVVITFNDIVRLFK